MKIESFTSDDNLQDFQAEISGPVKIYKIVLSDFKESESDKASKLAWDICNWLNSSYETIREFCASKLLDLKNEIWLNGEEEPLNKNSFAETIELESIAAYSDGSFTLYFDDKDNFWGHAIVVDVDKDYVLVDAQIAG